MGNTPSGDAETPKKVVNVHKNQRVIVVFGETGVGKSSMIKMIMGESIEEGPEVSDSARGCTLDSKMFVSGRHIYHDTAGFGEGSQGSVNPNLAISKLVKLLKNLEDGVSLLVYVIRMGKITQATEENYKLFVQVICQSKVPTILVITGCEGEPKMGDWYRNNKEDFEKKYKFEFKDVISACTSKGENKRPEMGQVMRVLYKDTEERIRNSIQDHALQDPWMMESLASWLRVILVGVINGFRSVFRQKRLPINRDIKEELKNLGFSEDKATEYTNIICEAAT